MQGGEIDMAGIIDAVATNVAAYGMKVVGAVAVLLVGRIVAGALRRTLARAAGRRNVDPTLIPFLSSMAYWLVMVVVLIAVLTLFGINTTSLVAVLGAASLAVGLALQGTLSNVAAGVMLSARHAL